MPRWLRCSVFALVLLLSACHSAWPSFEDNVTVKGPAVEDGGTTRHGSDPAPSSSLAYTTQVVGYDVDGEHVKTIQVVPTHILDAYGGLLLGSDRGEWGGELMFRSRDGSLYRLLDRNVQGIIRMPFGIVVFTGLAHMRMSKGAIYDITQDSNGKVKAERRYDLPGAPSKIRWTTDGGLVFETKILTLHRRYPWSASDTQCLLLTQAGKLKEPFCAAIH